MHTTPPLDILGIGISAVDDLLYIDTYPTPNIKIPVHDSSRHGGGLTATAMVAAAKLGAQAAYVARLGTDELSRYLTATLADHHVITNRIIADPTARPYYSVILVDNATGSRTIFYDARNFKPLSADDLTPALLQSTKLLFLDFLAEPVPTALAAKARAAGIPVLADVEGRSPDVPNLLPYVDYLVVSEEFAQWHTGHNNLAHATAALAKIPRAATVVTAGSNGCYWTTSPTMPVTHQGAFPVKTVDTTGCGDTYHGAFAFAIAHQFSVQQAILIASAAGALKAASRGGWSALPTLTTLKTFLHSHLNFHATIPALLEKL